MILNFYYHFLKLETVNNIKVVVIDKINNV